MILWIQGSTAPAAGGFLVVLRASLGRNQLLGE